MSEEKRVYVPMIMKNDEGGVDIVGDPDSLESLGHALIMKAKMGRNFKFTMRGGVNPAHIRLLTSDEFIDERNG